MKADAAPLLSVFEKKIRLEVPLFQRQYVWNRAHNNNGSLSGRI